MKSGRRRSPATSGTSFDELDAGRLIKQLDEAIATARTPEPESEDEPPQNEADSLQKELETMTARLKASSLAVHEKLREQSKKMEQLDNATSQNQNAVSKERTAWKETWYDAKLELFALEEKEKQAAEKKEVCAVQPTCATRSRPRIK